MIKVECVMGYFPHPRAPHFTNCTPSPPITTPALTLIFLMAYLGSKSCIVPKQGTKNAKIVYLEVAQFLLPNKLFFISSFRVLFPWIRMCLEPPPPPNYKPPFHTSKQFLMISRHDTNIPYQGRDTIWTTSRGFQLKLYFRSNFSVQCLFHSIGTVFLIRLFHSKETVFLICLFHPKGPVFVICLFHPEETVFVICLFILKGLCL